VLVAVGDGASTYSGSGGDARVLVPVLIVVVVVVHGFWCQYLQW